MPVTASIADWVGWMDFKSIDGMRECLAINNRTGEAFVVSSGILVHARDWTVLRLSTAHTCCAPELSAGTVRHNCRCMIVRAACLRGHVTTATCRLAVEGLP